ncbi:hypothetical protein E3N88_23038 [Mikania micrantha]|uniref:Leucine-rich repeat-containing N-terminal plant-type domain-containing protein n=1 Tax=Mikania micrantha TaxID=192012 RepID=A0A5N6NDV5_9ASTR|nr:hypothetical protein E3N88_23038 [Mikania micrantha]
MVGWAHEGIFVEEERKALLEIKASLVEVSKSYNDNLLPSWVVDDGSNYCDWERINCNSTFSSDIDNYKYVTDLSLGNMFSIEDNDGYSYYETDGNKGMIWSLNFSLFLHFKMLRRLDLSSNFIGNTFHVTTGLEILSGLKKLENLNLSCNFIEPNNLFPLLSQFTSLKVLNLSYINGYEGDSPTYGTLFVFQFKLSFCYIKRIQDTKIDTQNTNLLLRIDISEFHIPENIEVLDLTRSGFYGTLQIHGNCIYHLQSFL